VAAYAETGADVLHQEAAGARPIDLGVFDNEFEIADSIFAVDSCVEPSVEHVVGGIGFAIG
jgi:hypothetical protein